MSGGDDVVMVNNSYKTALQSARTSCVGPAGALEKALTAAQAAVQEGAWGGPKGEDFAGELTSHKKTLNDAGPAALADLDSAINAQPDRVESTAWQVRWHQMAPR